MWELKEKIASVEFHPSPEMELLHKRCSDSFEAFGKQMNEALYGDREPLPALTFWQQIKERVELYRSRVVDAWAVLTGKVDLRDIY